MFLKKSEHIILNSGRSYTANRNNRNKNMGRLPYIFKDSKSTSISKFQSPIKNQISYKKSIKFSLNKYHKYIQNLKKKKNNSISKGRPISLYLVNSRTNNREDIEDECLSGDNSYNFFLDKKRDFSDLFNSNSNSFSKRTLFSSNNNSKQKINSLNIGGSTNPINKNSSYNNNDNSNAFQINNRNKYLTLSINLKNSKFFNKTKYINKAKNINIKKYIKPKSLLSSYNIQLENSKNNLLYDTINEMNKKLENNNKANRNNNNNLNNEKDKYQMEKAQVFDILPLILNHMKQEETIENLYEKYNKYISKPNQDKSLDKNYKMNNPIIRYIFLENILNNLKHKVQFIKVQTKEQMEKYVIKVIGEEYDKLNNNINSKEKDFISYGYEYFPKYRNIFEKIKSIENKRQQTFKKGKESKFFIGEKKIKENNNLVYTNNNFRIWSTKKILIKTGFYNPQKKSKFIKKFEDKKDLKNEIKDILSNFSHKNDNHINEDTNKKNENGEENINDNSEKVNKKGKKTFKKIYKKFSKRSESIFMESLKPKYIKINLNKIKVKENNPNDNNKIDYSTDRMYNTPQTLENLDQENKDNNISHIKENNKINIIKSDKNISKFGINILIKKNKEEKSNLNKNLEKSKADNNEKKEDDEINKVNGAENKENNDENKEDNNENKEDNNENKEDNNENKEDNNESKEDNNEIKEDNNEIKEEVMSKETDKIDNNIENEKNEEDKNIILTKEDIEKIRKSRKIKRKNRKGLKANKKRERTLRNFMDNNELILNEEEKNINKDDIPKNNEQKSQSLSHNKSQNSSSSKEINNRTINSLESESIEESEKEIQNSENNNENDNLNKIMKIKEEKKEKEDENDDGVVMVSSLSESNDELEELKEIKSLMKTKTKKEIFFEDKRKIIYRRRGGIFIPSANILSGLIKNKEKTELNNKMKKIYEKILKKRKKDEFNKKRKKNYLYSFADVNMNDIKEIEKRKKMHLQRIKEDINYKIKQGKYHLEELDNFDIFNKAMNNIKFNKFINDKRRINQYVHYLEKYFQMFYNDLIDREKQKREEDRINKFLFYLHYDVGVMIPYVKSELGKHCKSIDYNKEVNLSELKSS